MVRLEKSKQKEALVIPAFEVPSGAYPKAKNNLKEMYKAKTAYQVHIQHTHIHTSLHMRWRLEPKIGQKIKYFFRLIFRFAVRHLMK